MPRYDKNPVLSPAFAAALREPPARTRRRCLVAQLTADTKRTHQKQQARRLASIQRLSTTPICSRNSVADDRACTRVTLPNLHGKEGVDGSSPSEGFRKIVAYGASVFADGTRLARWRTQNGHAVVAASAENANF